jgi:hypothetical protein
LVYVEDRNEPGTGVDQFWIEVKDKDRDVVPVMSMDREATDNVVALQGGNIAVPHGGGKGGNNWTLKDPTPGTQNPAGSPEPSFIYLPLILRNE